MIPIMFENSVLNISWCYEVHVTEGVRGELDAVVCMYSVILK